MSKSIKKANKFRIYKRVKLSEAFTDPDVFVTADEETKSVKAWKPITCLYEDKPITHEQHRKLIEKAKTLKLSKLQVEVAKLAGITKGYEYSETGGIEYVLDFGVKRFKQNTESIAHMNEMTPFQSDRFSPEEYLIVLTEDD
jgi:hypothetical protein